MLRRILSLFALSAASVLGVGCDVSFPDEEMHFGREHKTRPFAVIVDRPDASPGDTLTVTLLAWSPAPASVDIAWRAALDYDIGLYEADEVERRYVAVPAPAPTADGDGVLTQSFQWVVPDSVMHWTSALPAELDDPQAIALAGALLGDAASSPPRRDEVGAWLGALTPVDLAAMTPQTREAVWALADRFACQIRLRARLQTDLAVDVTRNVTVRHTRRLGGPQTNHNARIVSFAVVAVQKADASREDLADPAVTTTWHRFIDAGVRVAEQVEVPAHADWTYYAVVAGELEQYRSPFDYEQPLTEQASYRWYYYRQDLPGSDHQFFVTEDGEEAEMWHLKQEARIKPAGQGSRFRMVAVVRDERSEWRSYHAVPGATAVEGTVVFTAP
ncbi:MAG: hypothetical protein RBT60_06885 [Candidatus Krumholzibacteria bacterium]|jgi:hypothetical protein|nr:hypothetical protein [Candidatus Krumholzibacteria bacterium]